MIIFTPDSEHPLFANVPISERFIGTHYPIALYALKKKLHVLVTKPATQKLEHHIELIEEAKKNNVVCFVEHHKR